MSIFLISPIHTPPAAVAAQQIETPRPPKAQSDQKPANLVSSSHGPAVVLSGALAEPPERQGQQVPSGSPPQSQNPATGQPINRVI